MSEFVNHSLDTIASMTLFERLAMTGRIAACVTAGSIAGFLMWAIGAIGLGSVAWAAPLVMVVALFFGLPSFGLLLAAGMLFSRSIRRHTAAWCVGLPLAAMICWRGYGAGAALATEGTTLVAFCAATSSALFYLSSRYSGLPRPA